MNLEERVQWLMDHEEIRQLAYNYAISVDARDTDTIATLFAPDSFAALGAPGREGVRASYEQMLGTNGVSILNVGNHLITIDDADHAHGIVYCRGEIEDGDEWIVQQIVYRDRYVRVDSRWCFQSRQHLLFYGADLLERPIGLPRAGKPETWRGKGSMPEIWPTYQAFLDRQEQRLAGAVGGE